MAVYDGNATSSRTEEDPARPPPPPRFRSAIDYVDEPALRSALEHSPTIDAAPPEMRGRELCAFTDLSTLSSATCCDWETPKLDLATSRPHTMEDEVKRLMELKEYAILDTEHEEKFERITALASRIFDAPICLVSLVDIGRQWFKSNRGLGDVRETSRELSFCAHAILSQQDVFIVRDTLMDPRFVTNGLVTGPPGIRFYAGVPLVTPGGYKLGTFCIIDSAPRPAGLSLADKQNLRELTEMVVDTMVHRKKEMDRIMDEKTRLIACAAHDLLSPLTGIRLNLGMLMEDESLGRKMDKGQREMMEASVECSDMIERICVKAIESFRGDLTRVSDSGGGCGESGSVEAVGEEEGKGIVNVERLVAGVERVIGTYPKEVPLFVEKADNVPRSIVADDLKLFRSILNYLTNACKHTRAGSIQLKIYVRRAAESAAEGGAGPRSDNGGTMSGLGDDPVTNMELDLLPGALVAPKRDVFVVEVHDTGPGIDLENYPALFTPLGKTDSTDDSEGCEPPPRRRNEQHSRMTNSGLGLYSVATEIGSLGGEYGVFPRQDLVASHPDDHHHDDGGDNDLHDPPSVSGCVFWFSVPLVLPPGDGTEHGPPAETETAAATVDTTEISMIKMTKSSSDHQLDQKMAGLEMSQTKNRGVSTVRNDDVRLMPAPATKRSFGTANHAAMAAAAAAAKSVDDLVAKRPRRTRRVLIIDDSTTIRKGLARGFSRLGFEVDQAENGLQGFKRLKAEYYELVLLDFLMPVMDGPDVARKFRDWEAEHRQDFRQYIIGISAHANGKDAELGLKAGMDRFMGKPVPLKSLKDLAQCRPVMEASAFLDARYRRSCEALEAACRGHYHDDGGGGSKEDCGGSKSSSTTRGGGGSCCSTTSHSSTTSTFAKHSCLIVTKKEGECSPSSKRALWEGTGHSIRSIVEKNGWRVVVKHGGGEDALRLLKLRKWDVAFIDDDLPVLSGTNCLARFRDWERRSRAGTVRQRNVFVVGGDARCPGGSFDGVLAKPVDPGRVLQILDDATGKFKFNREILLR